MSCPCVRTVGNFREVIVHHLDKTNTRRVTSLMARCDACDAGNAAIMAQRVAQAEHRLRTGRETGGPAAVRALSDVVRDYDARASTLAVYVDAEPPKPVEPKWLAMAEQMIAARRSRGAA